MTNLSLRLAPRKAGKLPKFIANIPGNQIGIARRNRETHCEGYDANKPANPANGGGWHISRDLESNIN